jgi:hypothetical protein
MVWLYLPFQPGHDSYFHLRRLQALMDGMGNNPFLIYTDYTAIEGYGYFTKAFYPDAMLIPFAFVGNLTNLAFAYQSMLFTMTVLCGLFTYMAVNRIYKSGYAAMMAALFYTFAVYRLLDIYHRGALGEAMSFTFIPIAFLGLYEIIRGDCRKWYILTIGFSLLLFTHAIATFMMAFTAVIFLLIYYKSLIREPKRILFLFVAALVSIPVAGYYLFPLIEQLSSNVFYYQSKPLMSVEDGILGTYAIFRGMFSGIIYSERGFIPGIGLILTCAIALRLFVYAKSAKLRSVDTGVFIGLFFIFISSFLYPWKVFPFSKLDIIQIPWRLYEYSSFLFAVAGGYYISLILKSNVRRFFATGLLVAMTLILMANDAEMYQNYRSSAGIKKEALPENNYHLIGLEYLPAKVPSLAYLVARGDSVKSSGQAAGIENFRRDRGMISFSVESGGTKTLELPLIYYKGYTAKQNNVELAVSESKNGLVQIVTTGAGDVKVYYGGTFVQKLSWFVSLLSILGLCLYIFVFRKKSRKRVGYE